MAGFGPEADIAGRSLNVPLPAGVGSREFREAYGWVTQQIKAIADCHAKGRIVSALEGG
jgi:acetoin utilization deacetylase AcuC-like enzyme